MTSPVAIRLLVAFVLGLGAAGAGRSRAAEPALPSATGFVVWESNRSGAFRIWRQDLAGGAPRQVSPDEAGRDHCCAKLSPSGQRLVFLSLPGGGRTYSRDVGELHLIDADGGRDRVLTTSAMHYGEHRAAVWWQLDELLYLDGAGSTMRRWLSTGKEERLASAGANGEGWLIAPGGRVATGNTPTFSDWDARRGVSERASLGGCQPTFSADGRRAVWSAGAGGPIDAIDLATRESWTLLGKNDPRAPAGRGYLYFPMLAADSTLLAVAGSNGEHDHFRADYDILLFELDPRTLEVRGAARVVGADPAVDRFPDPFRAPPGPALEIARPGDRTPATAANSPTASGRALLWESQQGENRAQPGDATTILRPRGLAWFDRRGAMALGGGRFEADPAVGASLSGALQSTHQLTLAIVAAPASLQQEGALVALSAGAGRRNLVLRQRRNLIELVLRTSDSSREGATAEIAKLDSTRPVHLALTFSPGRLSTYVDGQPTVLDRPLPGDFFHWRSAPLTIGAEPGDPSAFRGALSQLSVWNRPLSAAEIAAEARRAGAAKLEVPADRVVVEARVRSVTETPSLASISPYREALVVDEMEIVRTHAGSLPGTTLRRVRWAILDGTPLAVPRPGSLQTLVLEPFAAQPQLQSLYLANSLGAGDTALWFDLGESAPR